MPGPFHAWARRPLCDSCANYVLYRYHYATDRRVREGRRCTQGVPCEGQRTACAVYVRETGADG